MELNSDDRLRLHILLKQPIQAIRIDEGQMTVAALTETGEARVRLNPSCRDEQYLRGVRELISTEVLGSPGGYPVFMRRWTRMGQARSEQSLERLLLLGEPEAAVAVAHTPEVSPELARRTWWAAPSTENARQLLQYPQIVNAAIGQVLAAYVVEHLPFEQTPEGIAMSVSLVLQPGLLDTETRQHLWQLGRRKPAYCVGFLHRQADRLPDPLPAHPQYREVLALAEDDRFAGSVALDCLTRVLSGAGQRFVATAMVVMEKPVNQELTVILVDLLGRYFQPLRPRCELPRFVDDVETAARQFSPSDFALSVHPLWADYVAAMRFLALVGEPLVTPILAKTDAVGTVLRKRLTPVFEPVLLRLQMLRGRHPNA